jgi:integration host factor subunit beta
MNKSDLIAKLADHYPQLVAKDAEAVVAAILEAMITSLSKGNRPAIRYSSAQSG